MTRITHRIFLTATLALYATVALAQSLTVTGQAESLAGDLVVLQTEGNCVWSVTPPELVEGKYRVCDGGKTLLFASRLPGTYYFTAASVVDGKPVVVTHRLDNVTLTPPIPLPPVEPEPPAVDIDAGIAALRQLAPAQASVLVKSKQFDNEKKALAESFLTTVKWIEANPDATPEQARAKQRENSRRYLSSVSRNSWQAWEAWDREMTKQLASLDAAKALTVEQIGQAYQHIGLGLQ